MAYSNAEIVAFLIANPNLTDAELASIMDATGVDASQIAEATGSKVEDIQARYEEAAPTVYEPPAAEEVVTPVTSLLDEPPAAPIVETVAAPTEPITPIAPVTKTGTEQMVDLMVKNPNLTDAELVKAMETYKVSPADLAKATVSDEGAISARVAATVPQGSSVTLGDTVIAPQYRTTGSGMDEQIGPLETFTTSKSDGDVNYKAPVGTPVNIYSPTGELVNTVKTKKDLSFVGGLVDMLKDPVVLAAVGGAAASGLLGTAGAATGAAGTAAGTAGMTAAELAQLDLALGGAGGTAGATSLGSALTTGAPTATLTNLTGGSGATTVAPAGVDYSLTSSSPTTPTTNMGGAQNVPHPQRRPRGAHPALSGDLMTRERWALLLGEWCAILGIEKPPRLEFVPPRKMPQRVAFLTEWYLVIEEGWVIKISTAPMADPEEDFVHELLHVRTGCTDQAHEPWIRDVAAALVGLKRNGGSAGPPARLS